MFKRPHSAKTQTPIRSSDLRKLRDELVSLFPSTLDKETAKALLPDGALTAKASSHLDEPLSLVLAPSKNGGEPDPRLFRAGKGNDGDLAPTVYTLDLLPNILPKLETAPMVVENLVSGSGAFLSTCAFC
jgi:translation initiation factor 2D